MALKLGVFIITSEFGCDEIKTFTCAHCNNPHPVKPKERPEDSGGHCSLCWELVCPACVGRGCDPFEEKLRRVESRARILSSYGI